MARRARFEFMVYYEPMAVITVYHGSDIEVRQPEIRRSNRALDFGCGFYTTLNLEQARSFADKVRERNRSAEGVVSAYSVDLENLRRELSVLSFERPDEAWLDFVSANRMGGPSVCSHDAVYGPVANDSVFKTFIAYQNGTLTKEETIARLRSRPLYNQLTFVTLRALSFLTFERSFRLHGGGY